VRNEEDGENMKGKRVKKTADVFSINC